MKTKSLPLNTNATSIREAPHFFFGLLFFLLALVPFGRTCYVVANTGADCISNDDIIFLSLTEHIWSGTYDWQNYFQDTFINGHCSAASQALFSLLGPLVAWNQYLLCSLGIFMAVLRTHIITKFLCASTEEKLYCPVLALVSWMLFSFSQISLFTTGIFSVMWQSCLLFTTLGAYLLWRYPDRLPAATTSSMLGVLACWNLAVGLPGWLVYLAIVLLRGARKKARAMIISTGMAIACLPYLAFVVSGTSHSRKFCDQYVLWFNPAFIVNALGRSFANDIGNKFGTLPSSMLAGAIGIIAFALFALLMIRVVQLRRVLSPAFILCIWSLAIIGMISIVRLAVAPWYALIAALFWSGLAAAAVFVIADCIRTAKCYERSRFATALAIVGPCLVLLTVSTWSWQYNRSYLDKQYYLENRTPVSASILRNYDIAPEAFASYVFKLRGLNTVVTGKMLERNRWSVFSQQQRWEMQGDSIFSLVKGYPKGVSLVRALWIKAMDETSCADFRTPKHLNLCILPGGSATWRVALPRNKKTITLRTSVALCKQSISMREDTAWSIAFVKDTNLETKAQETSVKSSVPAKLEWQAIHIDLSGTQGTNLSILFRNSSATNAIVFAYPILELRN